jgi:hypothetical protein
MVLRFLQTTGSAVPGMPFQPRQLICVPALTVEHRQWMADGAAELVRDEEPTEAVVAPLERAVGRASKRRA